MHSVKSKVLKHLKQKSVMSSENILNILSVKKICKNLHKIKYCGLSKTDFFLGIFIYLFIIFFHERKNTKLSYDVCIFNSLKFIVVNDLNFNFKNDIF